MPIPHISGLSSNKVSIFSSKGHSSRVRRLASQHANSCALICHLYCSTVGKYAVAGVVGRHTGKISIYADQLSARRSRRKAT